jgi:imidazolonepropionase-like amidohydrolase
VFTWLPARPPHAPERRSVGRRPLGIPPANALAPATRIPARMLGLVDEIGTVEVGKPAELVIVRDDPLRDLRALRTVVWTIKGGVARTPEEWMGSEPQRGSD